MIQINWPASWARVVPDKPALVDLATGRSLGYRELDGRADRAANVLREHFGVGRGDRVAVLGQNRPEQVELFFAAAKLGAILVPVNWRLAPDEIAYVLGHSDPKVLFHGDDTAAAVGALRAGLWTGPTASFDGGGADAYEGRMARASAGPVVPAGLPADTPLLLLYTSGTTGRPKGAQLTHGTITWNAINTATGWDLRHDDVTLTHTPFFHTGGWNVLTLPLLHRGATVLLARRFDAAESIDVVVRRRVTVLFAVPTMFQMMLDAPNVHDADFSSVRFFITGGASCPIPLIEAFQRRGVVFKQGYGLTEVGPNCFVLHERDALRKAGSVGFPILHLEARLVDAEGRCAAAGEAGELQLRGPTVCAGYWRDPEATAKAISADGWFATGDLFRRDDDGYYYVVGRLKEMYKSGGENVYPAEVERVLYDVPGVVEAAVVGVPDEKWGEVGCAFVALGGAGGPRPGPDEIVDHCRKRLAKFKVPRRVEILDALPKGTSGKIQKQELRARAVASPSGPEPHDAAGAGHVREPLRGR
jgi:fatty-acyl-CoA synthase